MKRPLMPAFLQAVRNFRARAMFAALRTHCTGRVLDVGGADFFRTAARLNLRFDSWTTVEPTPELGVTSEDSRYRFVLGDGCNLPFADGGFDSAVCLQVVEHVFEPNRLMREIGRALRPGGVAVLLVPQTSMLHMAPHHYYNFTRYWILEACRAAELEVVELKPIGGWWSTIASRLIYFFVQSARVPGYHVAEQRRRLTFYLLWPFMALAAIVFIPICLLLSLGDSVEEPNNHLVVARKLAP